MEYQDTMQMFDNMPVSELPDRVELNDGYYLFSVEDVSPMKPKEGEEEKFKVGLIVRLAVQEPEVDKGMQQFTRFYLGSDTDPLAQNPETLKRSRAFSQFKGLIRAAGLPDSMSVGQAIAALKGQRVVGKVRKTVSKTTGGEFVNVNDFYSPTAKEASLVGSAIGATINNPSMVRIPTPIGVPTNGNVTCGQCNESVPRSEIGAHMVSHNPRVANA